MMFWRLRNPYLYVCLLLSRLSLLFRRFPSSMYGRLWRKFHVWELLIKKKRKKGRREGREKEGKEGEKKRKRKKKREGEDHIFSIFTLNMHEFITIGAVGPPVAPDFGARPGVAAVVAAAPVPSAGIHNPLLNLSPPSSKFLFFHNHDISFP